jgi:excisionase family DNA binding protein
MEGQSAMINEGSNPLPIAKEKKMEKQFLEMNEASTFLRISKSTLYKKVMRKEIPCYKIGNKTIFDRVELIAFIKGHFIAVKAAPMNEFDLLTLPSIR